MLPLCRCYPCGLVICMLDHMLRLNESKAATLGKDMEPYVFYCPYFHRAIVVPFYTKNITHKCQC